MSDKKFKHTCKCVNCGNEAEMEIICSLEDETSGGTDSGTTDRTRGQAVCSQCGGEAEIWLDLSAASAG